jgi:hypothetical protein
MKTNSLHPPLLALIDLKLFALLLVLVQMGLGVLRVDAYDLSGDFSPVSNPNGPWQYGAMVNLGGSFSLFTVHQTAFADNGVPLQDWEIIANTEPFIFRNATTNTAISGGGIEADPPGSVVFHPSDGTGSGYPFAVARFTVPPAGGGSYLLQTTAHTYLISPSTGDIDFRVLVNGIQLVAQFISPNSGTNYTTTLNLLVGDTVDFVVGRGLDGNGDYSGGMVQASLTPTFCSPHHAVATPIVVNGFVVGANILDSGCGYSNAPLVLIQGGSGSGATATATINGGQVTAINIMTPGSSYTNAPEILIASPPFVPTLGIAVSKVKVTQHVVLGLNYVLEASSNLVNWAATGPSFTATDENIVTEFDVDLTGRYFRILQVP